MKILILACILGISSSVYTMEERQNHGEMGKKNPELTQEKQDTINKLLYYTILDKENTLAKEYLIKGADPNYKKGNTPILFFAIDADNIVGIRLLLEYGADANVIDSDFRTPLIHAITNKQDTAVGVLLEGVNNNKANVNFRDGDDDYSCPLYVAVAVGNLNIEEELIQNGADPLSPSIREEAEFYAGNAETAHDLTSIGSETSSEKSESICGCRQVLLSFFSLVVVATLLLRHLYDDRGSDYV